MITGEPLLSLRLYLQPGQKRERTQTKTESAQARGRNGSDSSDECSARALFRITLRVVECYVVGVNTGLQ